MSDKKPYDLLLRGGHVICPASEINSVMDVAIRDDQIGPASQRQGSGRRSRAAGASGHDRYPRPRLSFCHWTFRSGRGHGRCSFRRHHGN